MKRRITFLLALALLLALAACGGEGSDGLSSIGNTVDIRSFAHWASNLCATENVVYFAYGARSGNLILRYMDKATGITGPLCGKPECLHNDKNCNAYINGTIFGLTLFDGKLYWVENDMNMIKIPIYSVALDGTDRRIVREMDRDIVGSSLNCSLLQIHDGVLYWAYSPSRIENGEAKSCIRMVAFPLDPDEEGYVIVDEENVFAGQYFQPDGDNIYIAFVSAPEWPDLTRYEYVIYRWSIETKQLDNLYRGAGPTDYIEGLWPEEDGLVVIGHNFSSRHDDSEVGWKVTKYSFGTGEFELMYEDISTETASINITDGLTIKTTITDDEQVKLLVRDFEGNTLLEKTIPGLLAQSGSPQFRGVDDDYFYFYSSHDPEAVMVIPIDGSELHYIWTDAE